VEGVWLTPVEFQIYSGCASADWKAAVKIFVPDSGEDKMLSNKESNLISVKSLIEDKILTLSSSSLQEEIQSNIGVS